ncbi:MAG: serine/threonine protein kinase [Phycisphaerales bacterium]|nr:MAG: serine/threonine protein kinase [Phycisphaerales bacterium]
MAPRSDRVRQGLTGVPLGEQHHHELRRIFDLALSTPSADRAALLEQACGRDVALRQRVEAMIAAAEDDHFLNAPTAGFTEAAQLEEAFDRPSALGPAPVQEGPGTTIGPYRLLELLGEGGFGSVYMAEQRFPVDRKVAIKIIKLGMDTRQIIARFEAERQALAMMDHPNIAKVFDAGATESGRPYFVMDLVKGEPISKFCDTHAMDIGERLSLFGQVCRAVQHAHSKGIIHRDLKPSNILVSMQDARPLARVIDFGIAKTTQARLTEKTLFTEHRQLIGTPEYMSPEQADGDLDIDTRSDIYALGVLLYELLTGSTPFSAKELRSAAYGEMQRIIREVDPPKPSTRLSQSASGVASVAAARKIEPGRLHALIRGDLDWIVMKSLEKNRTRRYETASGLAADIERYLNGEAVLAAPPSRSYQLRKFVRRNWVNVSAASAVMVALLIGVVGFAWQAKLVGAQRDRAVLAEAVSERRADELQAVSDFQSQMLSQVDAAAAGLRLTEDARERFDAALINAGIPEAERGVQSAAFANGWARLNATDIALQLIDSTILTPALSEIDRQFADQPLVQAKLLGAIAERYGDLGLIDSAWDACQRQVELLRASVGEDHPDTIKARIHEYRLLDDRGGSAEAEINLRGLLDKHLDRLGADHALMLSASSQLGSALSNQARYIESEAVFREVLEDQRRILGDDHRLTMLAMSNIASVLRDQGRYSDAEPLEREVLERRRRLLGDDHAETIQSQRNFAALLLQQGKLTEAEEVGVLAVESARRVLGSLHPTTLAVIGNLAATMSRNGKMEEAEVLQRDVLKQSEAVLGSDHPNTINAMSNLATFLIPLERFEEAERLCRAALDARLRLLGRNHPSTLISYNVMGFLMQRQNRPAEAVVFLREALNASIEVFGEDHPERLVLLINMGSLSTQLDQPDDAETYFRDAIERVTRTLGEDHPYFAPAVQSLGDLLLKQQRYSEVVDLLSTSEPAFRRSAAIRDTGALARLLLNLGVARSGIQDFHAAEAKLTEAYTLFLNAMGPTSHRVQQCVEALITLYTAWHASEPQAGHDATIVTWTKTLQDATPPTVPEENR